MIDLFDKHQGIADRFTRMMQMDGVTVLVS